MQIAEACQVLGVSGDYIKILKFQHHEASKMLGYIMERHWGKVLLGGSSVKGSKVAANRKDEEEPSVALPEVAFQAMKGMKIND